MSTVVDLKGVSKKYCKSLRKRLTYGLRDSLRSAVGMEDRSNLRPGEFWALKDVSLSIEEGERVGILGRNGAGKSTLGKVISGILAPDGGALKVAGSIDQLIEITSGFHPSLSGRENARVTATLKGMPKGDFKAEIERIIEFTELGDFIDAPVKFYSSGMKARLGFAVATMGKPDVLIVDEALAVGDLDFRLKCYEFLGHYLTNTSLILVSHSMSQLRRFCSRGLVLNRGRLTFDGGIQSAIDTYEKLNEDASTHGRVESLNDTSIDFVVFSGDRLIGDREEVEYGSSLRLRLLLKGDFPNGSTILVALDDAARQHVAEWHSEKGGFTYEGGPAEIDIRLGQAFLNAGIYRVYVAVTGPDGFSLLAYTKNKLFRVLGRLQGLAAVQPQGEWRQRMQSSPASPTGAFATPKEVPSND